MKAMNGEIVHLEGGTVSTPKGFQAGATFAGLKTYREDKLDLAFLFSDVPCSAAGTFTTSKIRAASVILSENRLQHGKARAIVVNSGIANACVGSYGMQDATEMTRLAAINLGVDPEDVLICSTGLIGVELPMGLIREALPKIQLSTDGGNAFSRAILTTDTRTKEIAVNCIGDQTFKIGGVAKGSGMIHPQMATMLAFLTTDASLETSLLRSSLQQVVNETFNMITVDGDTSTNDSVIMLASGKCGGPTLAKTSRDLELFLDGLRMVCTYLAKEIVRDGEGASRMLEVTVEGAKTSLEARRAARAIASSSLVKTAVKGADPNWGRVVAALGASGIEVVEEKIDFYINEICIMEAGRPIPFHREAVVVTMNGAEVRFRVGLNLGNSRATSWGCDLTEAYVTFNSAYTT